MSAGAVVLLSGGLDSATVLGWARERGFACHALTVDYGQRHRAELERAADVARHFGARHRIVRLDLTWLTGSALTDPTVAVPKERPDEEIGGAIPSTYVPARNTVFLSLALGLAEVAEARHLCIGANAVDYSGYPDCRPAYLEAFAKLAGLATRAGVEQGTRFEVHAPLLHASKGEIVREAVRLGVPLERTWSCYDPADDAPCGTCDACRLRARGFSEAGIEDPTVG